MSYDPVSEGVIPMDYYDQLLVYLRDKKLPEVQYDWDGKHLTASHWYAGSPYALLAVRLCDQGLPQYGVGPDHPFILHYVAAHLRQIYREHEVRLVLRNRDGRMPQPQYPEPQPVWSLRKQLIHNCLIHPLLPVAMVLRKVPWEPAREVAGLIEWLHDQ